MVLLWVPDLSQGFTYVITSLKWPIMTLHAMASTGTECGAKPAIDFYNQPVYDPVFDSAHGHDMRSGLRLCGIIFRSKPADRCI